MGFGLSFLNESGLLSVGWQLSYGHMQVCNPSLHFIDFPCQPHIWLDYHLLYIIE